jgi:3-hydroxymyristoyl/3-hydroxydecanoyl-(acyl carrier protein) dehydratase
VLDPIRDVFLREHLMLKRPLLPGVIGLELLAQAAAAAAKSSRVSSLRNIRIHQGMRFLNDDPRDVNVFVRPAGRHWEAELRADFKDRAGRTVDAQRVHVTGTIEMDGSMSRPLAEHSSPPFPLNPMVYPDDSPMYHGRAFRRLESLMFQHDGGFGRLRAPKTNELAGERPDGNWFVPGALLDGCLVAVAVYSFLMCGQRVEIPETFEQLEFVREARPNEVCMLRFFFRGHDERRTTYDFILFGDDQQPILQCKGFSCVQLSEDRE